MRSRSASRFSWPSFFFNDTATTEIYTLSLHDALPICVLMIASISRRAASSSASAARTNWSGLRANRRSEEHTSELQSRLHLVCRLLLAKKSVGLHHRSRVVTARHEHEEQIRLLVLGAL